jgi:hypothetical protein
MAGTDQHSLRDLIVPCDGLERELSEMNLRLASQSGTYQQEEFFLRHRGQEER